MIIRYLSDEEELTYKRITIHATNVVRNEINRWRDKSQVVQTMGDARHPYQPRPFPGGIWSVGMPVERDDPSLWPYYIPTDATRKVFAWERDTDGYKAETEKIVTDEEYGIHHSKSSTTTLGCINVVNEEDLRGLVAAIVAALSSGEKVYLEVI